MSLRRWIQDHLRPLERAYCMGEALFRTLDPLLARLGYDRIERLIRAPEKASKRLLFEMRIVKEPEEIGRIPAAAAVGDAGMKAAVEAVAAGVTESQVAAAAEYAMRHAEACAWKTPTSSAWTAQRP